MSIKKKERTLKEIESLLESFDLKDKIEILANYFYRVGAVKIFQNKYVADTYEYDILNKPEQLIELLVDYKERFGEDIRSALLHQGLLMHMWLEQE